MSAAQYIARTVQNSNRQAAIVLLFSFLLPLLALVILITSGALAAFSAGLRGSLVEIAPYTDTFRLLNLLWTVGWIVQLLGFGALTRLLIRAGDEQLPILAFIAILIAGILGVLHRTFHMSVETWASEEASRTGYIPEAYEPLQTWIGSAFRIAYILHLLGTSGFGWSLLRTQLLSSWAGRATTGWGLLWLAAYLVGAGLPGILFIPPAVIGVALLRRG